MVILLDVMGLG